MPISDAKKRADAKYHKRTYEQIKISSRKELRISELIDLAADKNKCSRAQYITDAIRSKLAADGITVDMLPPLEDESDAPPSGTE